MPGGKKSPDLATRKEQIQMGITQLKFKVVSLLDSGRPKPYGFTAIYYIRLVEGDADTTHVFRQIQDMTKNIAVN